MRRRDCAHYLVPLSARSEPVPCVLALHAAFVTEGAVPAHGRPLRQARPSGAASEPAMPPPPLHNAERAHAGRHSVRDGRPRRVRDSVRRAVVEARRALDWLATRQEVDHARISIAGASLGIVSSICFKMDTRLASAALIATGSGLAGVVRSGTFKPLELARQVFVSDLVGWETTARSRRPWSRRGSQTTIRGPCSC